MSNCKTCCTNIGDREPSHHCVLCETDMHLTVGCTGITPVAINDLIYVGNHAIFFRDNCINRKEDFIWIPKWKSRKHCQQSRNFNTTKSWPGPRPLRTNYRRKCEQSNRETIWAETLTASESHGKEGKNESELQCCVKPRSALSSRRGEQNKRWESSQNKRNVDRNHARTRRKYEDWKYTTTGEVRHNSEKA